MSSSRTRTRIANMAADFLSSEQIGNIEEGVGFAKIYERNYDEAIETVIAEFPWLAAKGRAILQPISLDGQPARADWGGYANAYPYPVDCIKPISMNDRPIQEIHWDVETIADVDQFGKITGRRRVIYCDDGPVLSLRYAAMIEPGAMSAHLALACAIELAIRCEGPITNSASKAQKLKDAYKDATKGSSFRVGGWQVDSRSENPKPQRKQPTAGALARAGVGL